jgi:hypothetical protein
MRKVNLLRVGVEMLGLKLDVSCYVFVALTRVDVESSYFYTNSELFL